MGSDIIKLWPVKNMPKQTRRRLKIYAVTNNLTIPQAIDLLLDIANVPK